MLKLFRLYKLVCEHRGHDRMVIGCTTIYAIGAYHHWCCEFEYRSGRGVHHYVITFVSDFTCGWSLVFSTNRIDCHDIAEILLKVALNTIKPNYKLVWCWRMFYLIVILLYIINNLLLQIIEHRCHYNRTNSVSMNESINNENAHLTKNKCFVYDK